METKSANSWYGWDWLLSAAIFGLVFIYYQTYWQSVSNFVTSIDQCKTLFCDFFGHFYPMGQEILTTFQPVNRFYYSPFAAILFSWTVFATEHTALYVWGLVQAAAAAGLYLIPMLTLIKHDQPAGHRRSLALIYTFLFATSLPFLHNLKWGQVSVLISLFILAALLLYESGHKFISAILLALAISIKYYPAIFLVYFLLRRDTRYLLTCLTACAVFLLAIPTLLMGWGRTLEFYRLVSAASAQAARSWMEQDRNSQYILYVIRRLSLSKIQLPLETSWRLLGYLVSAVNVILLSLALKTGWNQRPYWAWALLFSTLPFWLVTSWPHYFVFLPLIQIFVLRLISQNLQPNWVKLLRLAAWGLAVILSNVITFNIVGRWQYTSGRGFLFFANLLLMLVLYSFFVTAGVLKPKQNRPQAIQEV